MEDILIIVADSFKEIVIGTVGAVAAAFSGVYIKHKYEKKKKDIEEQEKDDINPVPSAEIKKVEVFMKQLAEGIIKVVQPYQEVDPIKIEDLYTLWFEQEKSKLNKSVSKKDFIENLERLLTQNKLPGIVRRGQEIFIEEMHFSWKTTLAVDDKDLIAKEAVRHIKSGDVVLLDAGSTIIPLAREIAHGIKTKQFTNIVIITNFFKAVDELLKVALDLGMQDDDESIKVYVVGGRVRLNTLAIVDDDSVGIDVFNNFDSILESHGDADVAFVGTSGISQEGAFMTQEQAEVVSKQSMLTRAKKKFILADPSKFGVRKVFTFAKFNDDITIITTKFGNRIHLREYEQFLKNTNTKILYAEPKE
jgi:DeoR/GlpR family transcriptional regulator of sugar metabolism